MLQDFGGKEKARRVLANTASHSSPVLKSGNSNLVEIANIIHRRTGLAIRDIQFDRANILCITSESGKSVWAKLYRTRSVVRSTGVSFVVTGFLNSPRFATPGLPPINVFLHYSDSFNEIWVRSTSQYRDAWVNCMARYPSFYDYKGCYVPYHVDDFPQPRLCVKYNLEDAFTLRHARQLNFS